MKPHLPRHLYHSVLSTMMLLAGVTVSCEAAEAKAPTYHVNFGETLELSRQENIQFNGNSDRVILGETGTSIIISHNGKVEFNSNTLNAAEGVIKGDSITLAGNGNVEFIENTTEYGSGGAAISGYSSSRITIDDNKGVTFEKNATAQQGGAIYGGYSGHVNITNNLSTTFRENTSRRHGGAIFVYDGGYVRLSNNATTVFTGNRGFSGGAIYGGSIEIEGSHNLYFTENVSTGGGGATCSYHTLLHDNGFIEFSSNSSVREGGAIYGGMWNGEINLHNNESLLFRGNHTQSRGGAIYADIGTFNIQNNGSVLFEKNYEQLGSTYRLRSVYIDYGYESAVNLSAAAGSCIEFRDSMYVASQSAINLNGSYRDEQGNEIAQQGDILFTGKYTETHLNEILEAHHAERTATNEEVLSSRTTMVNAMTNLYGGRLRIEDGAVYKGNGITVHEGTAATVQLKNGELNHSGYHIAFNAGTTLELSGINSITAANLELADGSTMKFMVDAQHTESSALTYNGRLNMADGVALQIVSDDSSLSSGNLRLLTLTNGSGGWNTAAQNCAVIRLANEKLAGNLSWQGNTLYLDYREVDGTVDWEGGNGRWDGISGNWGQEDYNFSFTGQLDLYFGDKGSGTITIAGSFSTGDIHVENSEGHDYHWKNDDKHAGCLHGDHSFHKDGNGDLTVDIDLSYTGTTQVDSGTLTLNGSANLEGTFSNNGKVVINGSTTLGGDYAGCGDIEITGKLKFDKHDIEIGKGKDKDKADVHNNGKGNDDNIFAADDKNYEIENGHITAAGNNGLHLGNKLTDTSVENAGEGTLVITNGENTLNGIHANKGNVEVYGKHKHEMHDISIAGNLSVSFMTTEWEEGIDELMEAEISIFGTADFGENSILIADLVLESGCVLSIDGAVHMGSDVTLNIGTTLSGRLYNEVQNLSRAGEYVVLFNSVDALILNDGTSAITYAPGELTMASGISAATYFTNLAEEDQIFITFVPGAVETATNGELSEGGEIRLVLGKDRSTPSVPEPTTATLSLLALAALASRRRRK